MFLVFLTPYNRICDLITIMKKLIIITSLFSFSLLAFTACEKDDICGKDEETTPNFLIEFYNYEDQEVPKSNTVSAYAIGREEDVIVSTSNKLSLPLRLDEQQTDWVLQIKESNGNEIVTKNDTLTLKYRINTFYLNKACGYVSNFSLNQDGSSPLLNGKNNATSGNWIKLYITETNEILTDEEAHFKIYY